jgi:hypothetical protein
MPEPIKERLFTDDEQYNTLGCDIEIEARRVLTPLYQKWAKTVNVRDMEYVITHITMELTLESILDWEHELVMEPEGQDAQSTAE